MKPRHHLYLDDELTDELERLAAKPGASKSAIVASALRQYIRHRGGNEQDQAIVKRLDRLGQQNAMLQRDMDILYQALARYIRYYIIMTANMPIPDETTRRIGQSRYDNFIAGVGEAVAKAHRERNTNLESLEG